MTSNHIYLIISVLFLIFGSICTIVRKWYNGPNSEFIAYCIIGILAGLAIALWIVILVCTAISAAEKRRRRMAKTLKIGVLIPTRNEIVAKETGFMRSAGAIPIAVDRIRKDHLLDDYNFTFTVKYDECDETLAAGYAVDLMKNENVDALLGPTCSTPAITVGVIAAFYNVPVVFWGLVTAHELSDYSRFTTSTSISADSSQLAEAFLSFMFEYGFDRFAFIYTITALEKCKYIGEDLKNVIENSSMSDVTMSYSRQLDNTSADILRKTIQAANQRARIFATCFDDDVDRRKFFLTVHDMGLDTEEYLYVMLDTRAYGFGQRAIINVTDKNNYQGTIPFYIDQSDKPDGRDNDAMKAARRAISIDFDAGTTAGDLASFYKKVITRVFDWPFYCKDCNTSYVAAVYSRYLYDAMYMYAYSVNKTISKNPADFRNGTEIANNFYGSNFQGASGEVIFNKEGNREAVFVVLGMNTSDYVLKFATMKNDKDGNMTYYKDENYGNGIWANRGGRKPLSVPACGFDGKSCPEDVMKSPLAITGIVFGILLIIFAILSVIYVVWAKKKEEERLNQLWKIPYRDLVKHVPKKEGSQSSRSLLSGTVAVSTKLTIETQSESEFFALYYLDREPVVAAKHHIRLTLNRNDHREMRKLRNLDHSNVNKFLGLCVDTSVYMSIWKYCSRGSLQDVFMKESITMDSFFMYSLMRDILQGLNYIHKSFLEFHGNLTSDNCLVDDRWQVKLSDYGLERLRMAERLPPKKLLWRAPELLRDDFVFGTKAGDVYSFAIICTEIMSRKPAYDLESRPESDEEIVYMVKRGGSVLCRPAITNVMDFNPAFVHLIRDCWSENVKERPAVDQIIKLMKSIVPNSSVNLMDHVFRMMENYADSLEQEVEARTKELESEKKKSDLLLYRMMPKQIAEKLKMGTSVEPESFESVTVFFSDVVSFTTLASRCTPLQVVDLLNRLYTNFDHIIDSHDVYKVETIGDGYLCVSGLPHRNGDRHVKEIADMSLAFIASLQSFRIPHIPSETVQIRVGMHTGSVVAGVVGLTMPRYCLFGDTVNTASRMESNSKPNQIHMSGDAHVAIQQFPGYITESRGDVIIKGKGVMETFWLLGKQDLSNGAYQRTKTLNVGVLIPKNNADLARETGFERSAGAIPVAIDAIRRDRVLDDYNFTFIITFDECDEKLAAGYAVDMIVDYKVDALIGPTCSTPAITVGILAAYYNIPAYFWGSVTSHSLADVNRFTTSTRTSSDSADLAEAFLTFMNEFHFDRFAFIYTMSAQNKCKYIGDDLKGAIESWSASDVTMSYAHRLDPASAEVRKTMQAAIQRARIFALCFDDDVTRRNFFLTVHDMGLDTDEYLFVMLDMRAYGFGQAAVAKTKAYVDSTGTVPFYIDQSDNPDGRDKDAMNAARMALMIDDADSAAATGEISEFNKMVIDKVRGWPFYCTTCNQSNSAASYSRQLYDAMYVYAAMLNKTVSENPKNYRNGTAVMRNSNVTFHGVSGETIANKDRKREGVFVVLGMNGTDHIVKAKKREEEKLNDLWRIQYRDLIKHEPKRLGSPSPRSLASGQASNSTKSTVEGHAESEFFAVFYLHREPVMASKHQIRLILNANDHREMRKLRNLDHNNVNRFLGLCEDADEISMYMSIWKYCSRGSLQDVFMKESITMDSFFMYSLMRDILQGLNYIHNSVLELHGNMSSDNCLVDDRWQVKLSDYGLQRLRMAQRLPPKKLLWRAPELLRDDNIFGTKAGDVYSFAIICSEIMSRKPAYDLESRPESEEEIVYLVKRGGSVLCRPTITNVMDFNPAFIHLIRDCWSESARDRPAVDQIIKLMKSIIPNSNVNLMDHVLRMMENYADSLQHEVEIRTKELESEKKKSDFLLYRMMPKQIAEKLKLGTSVEPETFESVTVVFTDVVSFTTLASRCTPLQVVDLLNRLYTNFDHIIDSHDVYKVETIGDGYLCVSGLPHRNGDRHVKEIADMSLAFIASLQSFRIPHIPSETVQIRVGMHTGSVVAGVVGLTMPRYCLFGDTVNTASRMESNSKADQIHMSDASYHAIQQFPGYITESRGDVLIKGKGVMETFWLLGKVEAPNGTLRPTILNK
ncbi:hypothetical protein QR680_015190 [Steinernema hermaphroditum]|uniref:Guanylate cyclase n=1 Tax=Steinernema hermaphroditum TaxID=289476 RepID=A0AA39IDR9_9BILA|nr:hypothetical protein QR680_015190 [Steinernema hermaphroditum]